MIIHEDKQRKIVVIATGINSRSNNPKTGPMVQIWILHTEVNPVELVKTGLDAQTICKGCVFASGNGCYVRVYQAPLQIYRTYKANKYPRLHRSKYAQVFTGRSVRFGAYGNPSLIPIDKIKAIADLSSGWTGYFHDWHMMPAHKRKAYGQYLMASTETVESQCLADSYGLRSFNVSPTRPDGMIECIYTSKGLTCEQCKLCAGNSKSRLPSVWIAPHGATKSRAERAAL